MPIDMICGCTDEALENKVLACKSCYLQQNVSHDISTHQGELVLMRTTQNEVLHISFKGFHL